SGDVKRVPDKLSRNHGGARNGRDFIRRHVNEDERQSTPRLATICPGGSREIPRQFDVLPTRIGGAPSPEPLPASEEKGQKEYPEDRDNDILELRDVIEVGLRRRRLPVHTTGGHSIDCVVRRPDHERWGV